MEKELLLELAKLYVREYIGGSHCVYSTWVEKVLEKEAPGSVKKLIDFVRDDGKVEIINNDDSIAICKSVEAIINLLSK